MLDTMRQHRRNQIMRILVWSIFAILIFIFAVSFGPGSFAHQGSGGMGTAAHAAVVNGNIITTRELEEAYGNYESRYKQITGKRLDAQMAKAMGIKKQILDDLINRELVSEHAGEAGIRVSDKELRSTIEGMQGFQKDGRFDGAYYKRFVSNVLGTSPARFESQVRKDLLHQKVMATLAADVHVTPAEVKRQYVESHDKVNVAYVRVSPIAFEAKVAAPTPAEVAKVLKDRMDDVKAYYTRNKFKYDRPKKVQARHILIKVPHDATAAQRAAAKKKAQGILAQLKQGADFAKLAAADSDDSASKKQGGDLGWFGPGTMVKPLDDAAMSAKKGELYPKVITSDMGYHVLQVTGVEPAVHETLDQVKQQIAVTLLKRGAAKKLAETKAKEILAQAQGGKALDQLAPPADDGAGQGPVHGAGAPDPEAVSGQTGLVTLRGGYIPGIGRDPKLATAIGRLSTQSPVLDHVVTVGSDDYVLKLVEHQAPDLAAFAKQESELASQLKQKRVREVEQAWVKSLRQGASIQINDKVVNS